jgi:cytochrome c556
MLRDIIRGAAFCLTHAWGTSMKRHFLIAGAMAGVVTAVLGLGGLAHAQTAAQDIIVTRQAGFDLQNGSFAAIRAALAAKVEIKPYADTASGIVSWAKQIPLVFPKGSETGHDTKAKPEIWSDSAGFAKDAEDLATAAQKLTDLIKAGDSAGATDQVKVVGNACGACHRTYRVRTN